MYCYVLSKLFVVQPCRRNECVFCMCQIVRVKSSMALESRCDEQSRTVRYSSSRVNGKSFDCRQEIKHHSRHNIIKPRANYQIQLWCMRGSSSRRIHLIYHTRKMSSMQMVKHKICAEEFRDMNLLNLN